MIVKKAIKWLLCFFNLNVRVKLNHKKIIIPLRGGIGANLISIKNHETFMNKIINKCFRQKGAFVDVGINLGQTLLKFKSLFPNEQYIGVEPNPNCVAYVNQLIQFNNFKKCDILIAGLAEKNSVKQLLFDSSNMTLHDANASFIDDYRPSTSEKVGLHMACIDYKTFNSLNHYKIDLLKIDVEGGELYVLQGMIEKLKEDRPFIIIEVLPVLKGNTQIRKELNAKINKLISEMNYHIFKVKEKHYDFILEQLDMIPADKKELENYNYLLLPLESAKEFLKQI